MSEQVLASFEPGGPDSEAFMNNSTDLVRGIMGPIGSGKSVACCAEIMMRSCEQAPGRDGVRRTRWAIIRNTYPELKSTTIKTWLDWFPESVFGRMKWDAPITHAIAFNEPTLGRVEIEVLFLALDRPDHVKKLLSLEVTGVWINEARSVPKAIVDAATGRVGRYPSKRDKPDEVPADQWPTWFGVIMDTNPPDDDHWWYRLAEEDQPAGWAFYRQPSGLSPEAENKRNLPRNYYENLQAGKTPMWVEVYVHGRYGSVMDGKPVYPEYNDAIHCAKEPLRPILGLPLVLGFDFGLTPACIVGQLTPRGQIRIIDELIGTDIGIGNFCRQVVVPHLRQYYPQWRLEQSAGRDNNYIEAVGDPAGIARDGDERTSFELVRAAGIHIVPAQTNNFTPRREAVAGPLSRLLDGEPGLLISPTCKVTRKGFNGGYRYRRLQVAGDERFTESPEKNQYSHCFVAGTMVSTSCGEVPIESVCVGDMVHTPGGLRPVTRAWLSRKDARVMEVMLSSGKRLIGTPDHKVFANGKWVMLDALQYGDILQSVEENTWEGQQSTLSKNSTGFVTIGSRPDTTRRSTQTAASTCIERFGGFITERLQMAFTSIISMKTELITRLKTLPCFQVPSMFECIALNGSRQTQKDLWLELLPHKKPQSIGIPPLMGLRGTASTEKRLGPIKKKSRPSVLGAEGIMRFLSAPKNAASVPRLAKEWLGRIAGSMTSNALALFVARRLKQTNTQKQKHAVTVVGVKPLDAPANVYDLTVADQHCFYAEGVLVHNCHDGLQYLGLKFALPQTQQRRPQAGYAPLDRTIGF